ncbi:hypothetical protein MASR2M48_22110 [Spirochaetota bacterium]
MDEYVKQMIDRQGMRRPLQSALRYDVWVASETIALEMEASGACTRNYQP